MFAEIATVKRWQMSPNMLRNVTVKLKFEKACGFIKECIYAWRIKYEKAGMLYSRLVEYFLKAYDYVPEEMRDPSKQLIAKSEPTPKKAKARQMMTIGFYWVLRIS